MFVCVVHAVSGGMVGAGGWGFTGMRPAQPQPTMAAQTQNFEALFNSLFPINGTVTGTVMRVACI